VGRNTHQPSTEGGVMEFKKDMTGKLEKAVKYTIDKHRPDLDCLNFLCVWRDKEKLSDGKIVQAEVYKLSNKHRDVFGMDVMLEVEINNWKSLSTEEKKKLIFHELEHVQVEYELDKDDEDEDEVEEDKTAQQIFEELIKDEKHEGQPKRDKEGRVVFYIVPHDLEIKRFRSELLKFGLSPEEEAMRQYLNFIYKRVGMTEK
jgi:hypothetical protein